MASPSLIHRLWFRLLNCQLDGQFAPSRGEVTIHLSGNPSLGCLQNTNGFLGKLGTTLGFIQNLNVADATRLIYNETQVHRSIDALVLAANGVNELVFNVVAEGRFSTRVFSPNVYFGFWTVIALERT